MEERVKQTQVESLMTARQVADFLQVSVCTVGRWSRKGVLKFYRVGGRGDMRYQLKDVLRFLEESSSGSGADTMGEKVPVRPIGDRLSAPSKKARGGAKGQLLRNKTRLAAAELPRELESRSRALVDTSMDYSKADNTLKRLTSK